jgi:RNA polymerase sigma-32 factor
MRRAARHVKPRTKSAGRGRGAARRGRGGAAGDDAAQSVAGAQADADAEDAELGGDLGDDEPEPSSEDVLIEDLDPASPQIAAPLTLASPERAELVPAGGLVPLDPLRAYLAQLSRYPLLAPEEEHSLAVRAREEGDRDAAQRLVLSNLRLVVKIAMEYRRVWASLLDLIQEGNVGLLQAVKRFDPYRGVKLSSYGAYWIRAYILKYLIDNIRTVRLGSTRAERKLFFALNRAKRALEREGFAPQPALLAERLDVTPEDVESIENRLAQSDMSLDAPLGREEGSATLGDLQAGTLPSSEDLVASSDLKAVFREHIEAFSRDIDPREDVILRTRLLADEPRTLQEIGDEFGLTRERVRQIEKRLIGRMGAYMREHLVDFEYWSESEP